MSTIDRRRLAHVLAQLDPDDATWLAELLLPPAEQRARRMADRDAAALAVLADFSAGASRSGAAKAAETALSAYLAAGWLRERDMAELLPGASEHRRRLHRLARLTDGRGLGWRRLLTIADAHRGCAEMPILLVGGQGGGRPYRSRSVQVAQVPLEDQAGAGREGRVSLQKIPIDLSNGPDDAGHIESESESDGPAD